MTTSYICLTQSYRGTFNMLFVYEDEQGNCGNRFLIWNPSNHETAAFRLSKPDANGKRTNGGHGPIPQDVLDAALIAVPQAIKDFKTEGMERMEDYDHQRIDVELDEAARQTGMLPW